MGNTDALIKGFPKSSEFTELPVFVFLDVDGVLNNKNTKEKSPDGFTGVDIKNLYILKKILSNIRNPEIILSSSWKVCWKNHGKPNKEGKYLIDSLYHIGYMIHGFTEDTEGEPFYHVSWNRGEGIKRYLEEHPHKNYLILDDEQFDFYRCWLEKHFLHTNWRTGLVETDIKKAAFIVNRKRRDFTNNYHAGENASKKTHRGKGID